MSGCFKFKTLLLISLGVCLLLIGCGKKAKSDKPQPEREIPEITPIEEYLSKQDVNCESNQACPNYIAKIVISVGDRYRFCTGFLTEDNVVATSSSCLPRLLRLNGQDCSKDVFFFFPKTGNRPAERAGCREVLQVSNIQGEDPILWRDDVAFFELDREVNYRRQARIIRDGIQNNRQFTAWMIDQQGDFSAIVKKVNCESVHNNYINPLVLNEASPNMLFADCPVTRGGSGAPVIDNRGKVRAVLSNSMDPKLRSYLESTGLLTNGLKQISHATNFACAPTNRNNDMMDERECQKDLNYSRVDRARGEMLSTNLLFGELKKKFEESLNSTSKYVRFGVKLIPKGDLQETVVYPKCFKPLSNWLSSLNNTRNYYVDQIKLPVRSFRRAIDPYGRVYGLTIAGEDVHTYVQFSLKNLRSSQRSTILTWTDEDDDDVLSFPGISEECTSSLF